jgi:hypothetical protein
MSDSASSRPIMPDDPPRISERGASIAAGRLKITLADYRRHEAAGEAWCSACRDWHDRAAFNPSTTRTTGLVTVCRPRRNQRDRERYARRAGAERGSMMGRRFFLTARGAAVMSRQGRPAEAGAVLTGAYPGAAAPSGHPHAHCPPVLGCNSGRLPEGWVRTRSEEIA